MSEIETLLLRQLQMLSADAESRENELMKHLSHLQQQVNSLTQQVENLTKLISS